MNRGRDFAIQAGSAVCLAIALLASKVSPVSAGPFAAIAQRPASPIFPVLTFGRDGRKSVEDFAAQTRANPADLARDHAAAGLVQCGDAHGGGQLTLANNVVTTAAHVLFDEKGKPRADTCMFVLDVEGQSQRVALDLTSIVAGSLNPYAVAAVNDWAVVRLERPINGARPYRLATSVGPDRDVEFAARGHFDWGGGKQLSLEACRLYAQLATGEQGTREFAFDCETGDGASGGAVLAGNDHRELAAILVGWRSNKPTKAVPFSPSHYNFAVSVEGAFKQAVIDAAGPANRRVAGQR